MVSTLVEIYFGLDRQSEYISKLSINNLKKEANQNWILRKIERKEPSKKQWIRASKSDSKHSSKGLSQSRSSSTRASTSPSNIQNRPKLTTRPTRGKASSTLCQRRDRHHLHTNLSSRLRFAIKFPRHLSQACSHNAAAESSRQSHIFKTRRLISSLSPVSVALLRPQTWSSSVCYSSSSSISSKPRPTTRHPRHLPPWCHHPGPITTSAATGQSWLRQQPIIIWEIIWSVSLLEMVWCKTLVIKIVIWWWKTWADLSILGLSKWR